jgi:hypothetical protein
LLALTRARGFPRSATAPRALPLGRAPPRRPRPRVRARGSSTPAATGTGTGELALAGRALSLTHEQWGGGGRGWIRQMGSICQQGRGGEGCFRPFDWPGPHVSTHFCSSLCMLLWLERFREAELLCSDWILHSFPAAD